MAVKAATQLLTEELQFTDVMRDQHNSAFSFVRERGNGSRVLIRLANAPLICPFGLSQWQEQERKTINLAIPAEATDLRQFLAAMDAKVKAWVWENRASMFKTPPSSMEILESFHKPLMRPGKRDYSDTLQVKVSANTKFFAKDKSQTDASAVDKGCQMVAVVSPTRIWAMAGNEFGLGLELRFAMVDQRPAETPEDLFGADAFG